MKQVPTIRVTSQADAKGKRRWAVVASRRDLPDVVITEGIAKEKDAEQLAAEVRGLLADAFLTGQEQARPTIRPRPVF